MEKDFKSPVSTISPRGQRFDFIDKNGKRRAGFVPPLPPEKTGDVGTAARNPAQPHHRIPESADGAEFKALFWSRVKRGDGCWEWRGYRKRGYGVTRVPSSRAHFFAHRLAHFYATGEDPGDKEVCHRCDNPCCVNPGHLFLGTQADNMADKIAKGRHRNGPTKGASNGNAKLSEDGAREIIAAIMAGQSNIEISKRFPVGHALVSRIRTGKAWPHVAAEMGYIPKPAKYAPKSGRTAFGGKRL